MSHVETHFISHNSHAVVSMQFARVGKPNNTALAITITCIYCVGIHSTTNLKFHDFAHDHQTWRKCYASPYPRLHGEFVEWKSVSTCLNRHVNLHSKIAAFSYTNK